MNTQPLIIAFLLTLFAGLSTGIGSLIGLFAKKTNTRFLSISLGFSAGVMIYVSLVEIFPKAKDSIMTHYSDQGIIEPQLNSISSWYTVLAFFAGVFFIAIIDRLIPSTDNPHEVPSMKMMQTKDHNGRNQKLLRMGVFTALAIAIHNFPEGLATFVAALSDPNLGIAIAVAIAIHNIPEGVAVSVPIYYATGNKRKAFWYSFISGLAEPVGAIIGYLILFSFLNGLVFGLLFAAVAGIMVFISIDELLPAAREYGNAHLSIYGFIFGMIVMAISLLMFL